MGKTISARFSKDVIKPWEEVDVAGGKELFGTIVEVPTSAKEEAFERPALFFCQSACIIDIIMLLLNESTIKDAMQ